MRITLNVRGFLVALLAVCAIALTVEPSYAQGASAGPATEVIENPYGLEALWKGGDFVAKTTLSILFIMSLASWYVGIIKLIEQARLMREGKDAINNFWSAATVEEGARKLGEDSAFKFLADEGIDRKSVV